MLTDVDYNNFPLIVHSGNDFSFEVNCIKYKILPNLLRKFQGNRHLSFKTCDLIFKPLKCDEIQMVNFDDFILTNLDALTFNGSVCICLLGENVEFDSDYYSEKQPISNEGNDYKQRLRNSLNIAANSGYSFLLDESLSQDLTFLETLCLYAGLISGMKHPLFYFRVSGGPLLNQEKDPNNTNEFIENPNPRMERLKQKLIRVGSSIRFYGSTQEFENAIESDLINLFQRFPDIAEDKDVFLIDRICFEKERLRWFTFTDNIHRINGELEAFYSIFFDWNLKIETHVDYVNSVLEEFYRQEFSDKLTKAIKKISVRNSTVKETSYQSSRIFVLSGPRGSGKSSILVNWLSMKEDSTITRITHYCEASPLSSDLRLVLQQLTKQIRISCGFKDDEDCHEILSLEKESLVIAQKFLGALLLAKSLGRKILIVIDGVDYLCDKIAVSTKNIKDIKWIPDVIPDNVRFIFSCSGSDIVLKKLINARNDFVVVEMFPLTDVPEELIMSGIQAFQTLLSSVYNQKPNEYLLENLEKWPLIINPLAQRIMTHIFHTLGTTEQWTTFVEKISECQSLVELIKRTLRLWIDFLNWDVVTQAEKVIKKKWSLKMEERKEEDKVIQGWIPDCLSLIAISRCGLSVETILECLIKLGYTKEFQVSEADFLNLFHYARNIMLRFHQKKIEFSHSLCKEIVENTFLAIANCSSIEAHSRETDTSMYVDKRCKLHLLLAYQFWQLRSESDSNLEECIYHLEKASDYDTLEKVLIHPRSILQMVGLSVEKFTNDHSCFCGAHQFLHYWQMFGENQHRLLDRLKSLIKSLVNSEIDEPTPLKPSSMLSDQSSETVCSRSKDNLQSKFAKRVAIQVKESEKNFFSKFDETQQHKFLFLLSQIASATNNVPYSTEINKYIIKTSCDSLLLTHVLLNEINKFLDNFDETEMLSYLARLNDEKNGYFSISDGEEHFKRFPFQQYLQSISHVNRLFMGRKLKPVKFMSTVFEEAKFLKTLLRSASLESLVSELESNFLGMHHDGNTQKKIELLSMAIFKLETSIGAIHLKMAHLWFQLAQILSNVQSQSIITAEACCRRVLWIISQLRFEDDRTFNYLENQCHELLVLLLLQNQSQLSISEAKQHLDITFDNRVKEFGCYHPLTRRVIALIKLVNASENVSSTSEKEGSKSVSSRTLRRSALSSATILRVDANSNQTSNADTVEYSMHQPTLRSRPTTSFTFASKCDEYQDTFRDVLDYSSLNGGRSSNFQSKNDFTRINSASTGLNSSRISKLDYFSQRLVTTPLTHTSLINIPKNIYTGTNSAISTLSDFRKLESNRNAKGSKQVHFQNFQYAIKDPNLRREMAKRLQHKLELMKLPPKDNFTILRRPFSANFSRPYSNIIDPML